MREFVVAGPRVYFFFSTLSIRIYNKLELVALTHKIVAEMYGCQDCRKIRTGKGETRQSSNT